MHQVVRKVLISGLLALALCAGASVKGQSHINSILCKLFGCANESLYCAMKWDVVNVLCSFMVLLCVGFAAVRIWKRKGSVFRFMLWTFLCYTIWNDTFWTWARIPCAGCQYNHFIAFTFIFLALEEAALWLFSLCDNIGKVDEDVEKRYRLLLVDEDDSDDLLGFKEDASLLVTYLMENVNEQSAVGVAVMGSWGTGKTRFLKYMGEFLKTKGITPVAYNPWKNKADDHENTLLKSIAAAVGLSNETRGLLEKYADEIKVSNIMGWASVIAIGIKNAIKWFNGNSSDTRNLLKEAMAKAQHPTFVFMDDCDRLEFNAFKDVLSLIRGTADLPKLVFVVAFDAERARKMLESTGDDKFMQKMFNVPHVLTPVSDNILTNYILGKMKEMGIDFGEKTCLFSGISLIAYLPTFREAKRWLNMLYVDYQGFKDSRFMEQIVWRKWVLVELLKFCDSYLYEQLKNSPDRLLQKEVKEDLNDHVYTPRADMIEAYPEHMRKLMDVIYKNADLRNPFDVSNQVYHELYFYVEPVHKMLTKEEFLSHETDDDWKTIIGQYMKTDGYQNIPNLIADSCSDLLPTSAYPLMTAYLEFLCDYPGSDFTTAMDGSMISRYRAHAHAHPFLATLVWLTSTFVFDTDNDRAEKEANSFEEYCKHPTYRYALIAIMADAMVRFDEDELIDVDYYYEAILNGMLKEDKADFTGLVWAIAYCPQRKLMEAFLKDFLDAHFTDCLPNLLTTITKDKKEMLIVRHNALRALFDTYDNMGCIVKRWRKEGRYDLSLLDEFESLVVKTMCFTPVRAKDLEKEHFPLLSQYKSVGVGLSMPLNAIRINKDFWGTESRFKTPANYYFAQDAN